MEDIVFVPRITLNTGNNSSLPLTLYRILFPFVLAFSMTINKSQGQSFDKIGFYYENNYFLDCTFYCLKPKIEKKYSIKINQTIKIKLLI